MNISNKIINKLNNNIKPNIAIIGDIILDKYIFGDVNRISPEAPVPVLLFNNDEYRLGGSANVASNLTALGACSYMLGLIGQNKKLKLIELFNKHNINIEYLNINESILTSVKTRFLSKNHQLLRLDLENQSKITDEYYYLILKNLNNIIENLDIIIIQDYNKGIITQYLVDEINNIVKNSNKKPMILVDPNPNNNINYYNKIDLIKPNFIEALKLCNLNFKLNENNIVDDNLKELGNILYNKTNSKYILITLSEYGMALFEDGKFVELISSVVHKISDVTGAGDTVLATLAFSIANNIDIIDSCKLSSIAAGIVVEKLGTACISLDELIQNIKTI